MKTPHLLLAAFLTWTSSAIGEAAPAVEPAPAEQKPAGEKPADAPPAADAAAATAAPAATPAAPVPAGPAVAPAAPATEEDAEPAVPAPPKRNRNITYARELVAKGRFEQARKELETAATLPGNDGRTAVELASVRAQLLLLQKKPDPTAARDLIVEVLHSDPEATFFTDAPEAVKKTVDEIRGEQPLVLHESPGVAKPGKSIKLRARLIDPKSRVATLRLFYKAAATSKYSSDEMRKDTKGYSGLIRDPSALAPSESSDEYRIDYYLAAEDAAGRTIDTNGTSDGPLHVQVSGLMAEATTKKDAGEAFVELGAAAPKVEVAPEPEAPIYTRWYVVGGAAVVVATIAGIVIYAVTRPEPLPPHIGEFKVGSVP